MSEACNHDCASCGADCAQRDPKSFLEAPNKKSSIKKVIGVVSGKGGVGKSLVTGLLATAMQRQGYHAGILDADITGPSIPKMFGIKGRAESDGEAIYPKTSKTGIDIMSVNLLLENDTDPVVWRGPIISGVVKQFWTDVVWKDVDFLFVDMPPGTGDVSLTVFQSLPLAGIVVVASPQELVSMIVKKAVKMADMMNIPVLGIVENMSYALCPDCGKQIEVFGKSRIEETAKEYHIDTVSKIPIDPKLAAACDAGTIELFDGNWLSNLVSVLEQIKGVE